MIVVTKFEEMDAKELVRHLKWLLKLRYRQRISRKKFLESWGYTRQSLYATVEYQDWVAKVKAKSNCKCTECGKPGEEADHTKPVSRYPDLIFDVSNGEYRCKKCHKRRHKS